MRILICILLLFSTRILLADAVIFSGNDVKALKFNLDLFGRSKVMGLNVDPSAGGGVVAPLGSIGMDYLTGEVYYKSGAGATQWTSISGAIEGPANTFAAYNANGILSDLPWMSYTDTATDFDAVYINKAIPATVTNVYGLSYDADMDGQTATEMYSFINLAGVGATTATIVNNFNPFNNSSVLGPNADIDNAKSFTDFTQIQSGSVVDAMNSFQSNVTINEDLPSFIGYSVNTNIGNTDPATITNMQSLWVQNNFDANAAVNNVTELAVFSNFQTGSEFDDYQILSANPNISSSTPANTVQLINMGAQIGLNDPTTLNSMTGMNLNPTIKNGSSIDNYNGFSLGVTFETGSDANSINMISNYPVIDIAALQNYSTFNSNANIGTNSATAIQNYNDINLNTNIGANASIDNFNGITVRPNAVAGAVINNNYTGIDVGINNPLNVTGGVTGINITMDNFVTNSQKQGLTINNGSLSVNSVVNSSDPWFGAAAGGNYLGGTFNVISGSPVLGGEFVFGNNLAFQMVADDDMGPDFTTLGIGYTVVGFVGQASVTAGNTVDTVNLAGAGVGIPPSSTGGTITDLTLYKAIGALPQGGTINVTNLYGFRAGAGLTTVAPTNVWGISIENPDAENYFEKSLAIDTATKKVSSGTVGLEIGNGKSAIVEGYIGTKTLLRLEDPDPGTNEIDITAPTTLATNYTLTLPVDDGLSGQILSTDGSGVLSWINPASNAFIQGGNSFGATAVLGTNDANNLQIETNNAVVATFDQGGSLAINGTSAATTSAALDVQGTDGAVLLPRLTTAQRSALTPTAGMMIYNTTTAQFECYVTSWIGCDRPETPWWIEARLDGANPSLGTASVGSFTGIESATWTLTPTTGSAAVGAVCSGTNAATTPTTSASTCAAGNESSGISFDNPVAGTFEVCVQGATYYEVDQTEEVRNNYQLVETPTNAQTITVSSNFYAHTGISAGSTAGNSSSSRSNFHLCSNFTWGGVATRAIRLFYNQTVVGTPNNVLFMASTTDQRPRWSVRQIK